MFDEPVKVSDIINSFKEYIRDTRNKNLEGAWYLAFTIENKDIDQNLFAKGIDKLKMQFIF